jgi:hypothetical protein
MLLWVLVRTEDELRDTISAATRASSGLPGARATSLPKSLIKGKMEDASDVMQIRE